MDKLLLPFIFCFYFGNFFPQNNYASHTQIDSPTRVLADGDLFFYTTTEGEPYFSKAHLYAVTENRTLKFKYDFPFIETVFVTDLKKCTNGNIGVAGFYMPQCDVLEFNVFYAEVDTNGTQQILMSTALPRPLGTGHNVKFFEWISGDKILATDSALVFSQNGGLSTLNVNLGRVNSIYDDQAKHVGYINNTRLTNFTIETNYFSKYDLVSGDSITTFPFQYKLLKILKGNNNSYYGLTDSSFVIKFDTLFNITGSSKLNQGTHQLNDFDLKDDTIYACTKNSLSMIKLDPNLNMVYQYQNPQTRINFNAIDAGPHSVTLLAWEEANNLVKTYPNSLLARTPLNGIMELKNDAFVENVTVVNGYANPYSTSNPFPGPQYVFTHYSLMIKVRNNGTDTLKTVYVNQRPQNYYNYICNYTLNHHLATNLSVPPGQFVNIITPMFHDMFLGNPQSGADSVSFSTCAWTSAPNFNGDNNHMNDALCNVIIKLPILTSVPEHDLSSNVRMFPNPATETLNILFLENTVQNASGVIVSIRNLLGETIKTHALSSNENAIDITELQSGIYVVEITKNNKPLYQSKLVKQ